jgi:hypothetical protein
MFYNIIQRNLQYKIDEFIIKQNAIYKWIFYVTHDECLDNYEK